MSADLLRLLAEGAIASTLAIATVVVLRRPVGLLFGARQRYALWLLVPVAMLATALPAPRQPVVATPDVVHVLMPARAPAESTPGPDPAAWLLVLWAAGAAAAAALFGAQQVRFRRGLGRLVPREGGLMQAEAEAVAGLPAASGLWRPRVIVPADFTRRYTPDEQALLVAHERAHVAAGDLVAHAVATGLRALWWFNPFLHLAIRVFRQDQELACDARVLAAHPAARRRYGEILLKTQLAAQPSPWACHWGYGHPLTERVAMLKRSSPSRVRVLGGAVSVALLAFGVGYSAWATQGSEPASTPRSLEATPAGNPAAAAAADGDGIPTVTPAPRYPKAALEAGIGGRVELLVDYGSDGTPTAVEVEKSTPPGVFDQAAIEAARNWRITPERKDGKPVAGRVRVPVDFSPDGPPKAEG